MATQGKIPMLGFKAAAIKFVTLFGFSPVTPPAPGFAYLSDEPTAFARVDDIRVSTATVYEERVYLGEVHE